MPLTLEQRVEYLKALEYLGGEEAHRAGLELLQAEDSRKSHPKGAITLQADHVSQVASLAAGLALLGKWRCRIFCGLECAPHAIAKDWPGLAS